MFAFQPDPAKTVFPPQPENDQATIAITVPTNLRIAHPAATPNAPLLEIEIVNESSRRQTRSPQSRPHHQFKILTHLSERSATESAY
jgi:hypothetical protein